MSTWFLAIWVISFVVLAYLSLVYIRNREYSNCDVDWEHNAIVDRKAATGSLVAFLIVTLFNIAWVAEGLAHATRYALWDLKFYEGVLVGLAFLLFAAYAVCAFDAIKRTHEKCIDRNSLRMARLVKRRKAEEFSKHYDLNLLEEGFGDSYPGYF